MDDLGYRPFDGDNHYYEALDAFTRHMDKKMAPRCVQWAEIDGRKWHVVGGRVSRAVLNATFDPVVRAGALHDYFRGNPDGKSMAEFMSKPMPIPAEFRDRDARLRTMDEQGLSAMWLFPTLGILYEEQLKHDHDAVIATFRAFNRWLEEDWGFAYQDRIFGSPYIPAGAVDFAVSEVEWAIERGARTICLRPAPFWTADGPRSPGDPMFDKFWDTVNQAGITVVVHAGDSGYSSQGYGQDGFFSAGFGGVPKPSIKGFNIERAAMDFLITLVFDRVFERFPNVRVASVENGSDYLAQLFLKLRQTQAKYARYFQDDPVESFKQHVWINPFWEDDPYEIVELMGADRVIFGSDWPHVEGMPEPLDYLPAIKNLSDADRKLVLLDNVTELNTLRPL